MGRSRRRDRKILRVGTDCSGIEAPIQALQNLKVPFRHVFSSEIDKSCVATIKENYSPEIFFGDPDGPYPNGDIRTRNINDVPDIDLYVCGFPCQPFSTRGARGGIADPRGRVFEEGCLRVLRQKRPKFFILENVGGLLRSNGGRDWAHIRGLLEGLPHHTEWGMINSVDHGVPQNRPRLYIVGRLDRAPLFPPPPRRSAATASSIVSPCGSPDKVCASHAQRFEVARRMGAVFANLGSPTAPNNLFAAGIAPCLTTRGRDYWNVAAGRKANVDELLKLQGMKKLKFPVSEPQAKSQIGNSMTVTVVEDIITGLLS